MNFRLAGATHKLRTDVVLADRDTHETFTDKMRYIFLELPSFDKEENECETDFERWIYVLKNMETLQRLPFKARNAVFQKLEQIVDIAALSKEDRMKYDESIKVYRDQLAVMTFERQQGRAEGKAEGLEQGRAEGKAEGLEQGRAEGLEQGRAEGEHLAQLRMVRRMKEAGLSAEQIARMTGLTMDEVEALD